MRKLLIFLSLVFVLFSPTNALAQKMLGATSDGHTAREEAEGKEIWEKFQNKEVECEELSDEDFGSLGEYFMGQMAGEQHEAMNKMMIQMMGEEGEKQMHIALGKRMSGCDPDAPMPQNMPALSGVEGMSGGMMPMMMNMMIGGGGNPMPALSGVEGMGYGGFNNMMGGWSGLGILGWLPMILFWILLILGIVALLRYLAKSGQQQEHRTPLDILKERYARGEIDKKEFEQMKKDLN